MIVDRACSMRKCAASSLDVYGVALGRIGGLVHPAILCTLTRHASARDGASMRHKSTNRMIEERSLAGAGRSGGNDGRTDGRTEGRRQGGREAGSVLYV